MKRSLQDDVYRFALSASWPMFFGAWAVAFAGLNALFACLYLAGGDGVGGARLGSFADLFFFSVETFATVGYGDMVPKTGFARLVATVEAFASISSLALATGLIFTRFSRPNAGIVFAPVVAVATVAGFPTLMVKLGNRRRDAVVETSARLWLIWVEPFEGADTRRYRELVLDKSDHPFFMESWTLFHVIDETSPLHGMGGAALVRAEASFLVTVRGTDQRTLQVVTAHREYAADDVRWNERFTSPPNMLRKPRKGACVDFDLIRSDPEEADAAVRD